MLAYIYTIHGSYGIRNTHLKNRRKPCDSFDICFIRMANDGKWTEWCWVGVPAAETLRRNPYKQEHCGTPQSSCVKGWGKAAMEWAWCFMLQPGNMFIVTAVHRASIWLGEAGVDLKLSPELRRHLHVLISFHDLIWSVWPQCKWRAVRRGIGNDGSLSFSLSLVIAMGCHGALLSSYVVGIPTSHFMFGAVGLARCRWAPVAAVAALASIKIQAGQACLDRGRSTKP